MLNGDDALTISCIMFLSRTKHNRRRTNPFHVLFPQSYQS